jgi:hypothetical protein
MRGAAILFVVVSHCGALAWNGRDMSMFPHDPIVSFIAGATSIFVFISGFFFHHVFRSDFHYPSFLRKKATVLLPPFLAMTLLLLVTERLMGLDGLRYGARTGFIEQFAWAAFAGTAGPAMWYLPFIFDMFLLSPLFLIFMRAGWRTQIAMLVPLLALGLLVERSFIDRLANVAHFSFYYAFGIFCSIHRERFVAIVSQNRTMIAAVLVIVVLAAAQYTIGTAMDVRIPHLNAYDFIYFRKIALILLLAGVMARVADKPVPGLTLIAQWSFGLFFVHQFALVLLTPIANAGWFAIGPDYVRLALVDTVVLAMSLCFVGATKLVLGRNSRLVVGA